MTTILTDHDLHGWTADWKHETEPVTNRYGMVVDAVYRSSDLALTDPAGQRHLSQRLAIAFIDKHFPGGFDAFLFFRSGHATPAPIGMLSRDYFPPPTLQWGQWELWSERELLAQTQTDAMNTAILAGLGVPPSMVGSASGQAIQQAIAEQEQERDALAQAAVSRGFQVPYGVNNDPEADTPLEVRAE